MLHFGSASRRYQPGIIDVLTLEGGKIAAVTAFVFEDGTEPAGKFATFALPRWLPDLLDACFR